jgi:hypothetical protein
MTDRTSTRRNRPAGNLHSIDELAERWGVSPGTVQRQIKSGALPAHPIERLVWRERVAQAAAESSGGAAK